MFDHGNEPSATCPWKCGKNIRIVKDNAIVCFTGYLQLRCAADELGELWSVQVRLKEMEMDYIQVVEQRAINRGYEMLQVFTRPSEP